MIPFFIQFDFIYKEQFKVIKYCRKVDQMNFGQLDDINVKSNLNPYSNENVPKLNPKSIYMLKYKKYNYC